MQWHRGGYTIDTDRQRLDMNTIVQFTHWLHGTHPSGDRGADTIYRSWDASGVVMGVYFGDALVGCARVVTDFVSVAYLTDVFILPEHRGRGVGSWMMECLMSHPDLGTVGWLLHTRDAHKLYASVGFEQIGERLMERRRLSSV